jgi:hypothetical protein
MTEVFHHARIFEVFKSSLLGADMCKHKIIFWIKATFVPPKSLPTVAEAGQIDSH